MNKITPFLPLLIIFLIPSISLSKTPLPDTPCDSEGTCIEGDCKNGKALGNILMGKNMSEV